MACETAWVGSSFAEGPPSNWTTIHLPLVSSYASCAELVRWCVQADVPGEFGFASAFARFNGVGISGSVWAFSDPQVAFEFKLRFG